MTTVHQDHLIDSVADALQYMSYYHPVDFIKAVHEAYIKEESRAAKDAMAQILINSRMCAEGHRPEDLGMEAIYEFEVKDMPVTVAVDARGNSVHQSGPAQWKARIEAQAVRIVD